MMPPLFEYLFAALALPFLGAFALAFMGRRPNLRDSFMIAVAVATAAAVLVILFSYEPSHSIDTLSLFVLMEAPQKLSIAFHLEPLGILFATIASSLWVITAIYAIGYMRANNAQKQTSFFACFSIAIGSALGIAFAANMLTLFIFYEILSLSTYPLVIHQRDENAKKGGRFYLAYLLGTSFLFLLLAAVWTAIRAGTLDFTPGGILPDYVSSWEAAILLALYAFGIGKAALMPLHRWLPEAMVAPTPVSALLHAVAVVKAGVFTILKVGIYIFGAEFLSDKGASQWLIWVACFSILAASIIALAKTDLKARLAYSTVSQLSYVTLAMAVATPAAFLAGAIHIASHSLAKVSLFMCAGSIYTATGKKNITQMEGLGRIMPITFGAFLLAALSIIGLPPFLGMWSKWRLGEAIIMGGQSWSAYAAIAAILLSSILNILYLFVIPMRGFMIFGEKRQSAKTFSIASIKEAPLLCIVPPCLTALACILFFFFIDSLAQFLEPLSMRQGGP